MTERSPDEKLQFCMNYLGIPADFDTDHRSALMLSVILMRLVPEDSEVFAGSVNIAFIARNHLTQAEVTECLYLAESALARA